MASPKIALVFLGGLGLRLISRRGGLGLSLVFVLRGLALGLSVGVLLIFFGQRAIAFWAPRVNVPNIEGWLQVNFCFCIICFLHHFFLCIYVSSSMVQLGSDR